MRRLDAIRARYAAATPGPWFASRCSFSTGDDCCQIDTMVQYHTTQDGVMHCYARDECVHPMSAPNGAFIAGAREDVVLLERMLRRIGEEPCELLALRGVMCASMSAHATDWCWPCRVAQEMDLP